MSSCGTTNVKFRLKRGTTSQWLASTLPLALGEPGYDIVNNDLKIGDGTSLWKDLVVVNYTLTRNIGLNAYIQNATFTGTYSASDQWVTYSIVLFGNSSRYDIGFTYADPNVPAALTPISASPVTSVTNTGTIYNHSSGRSETYIHESVSPAIGGTYLVTMTVSTANAGGTGTGSTFSVTNSVSISSDIMGNPSISSSSGITLSSGSVVRISGIDYFTSGTVLTIPASALQLDNIYNIVNPSNYTYLSSSSPSINNSTTNLRTTTGGDYPGAPAVNARWQNLNSITGTLNASSFSSPIYATSTTVPVNTLTVTNALNKTRGYSYDPFNANLTTGTPSRKIAYVSPWNNAGSTDYQNERLIPKNQGGTTNAAIGSQTRTRYAGTGSSLPYAFSSGEMLTFNPSSLFTDEPLYFPFDGNFYSSTSPPFSSYVFPSSTSFTPGTKYLCIAFTNSAALRNFTLYLPGTTGITNIYVAWFTSGSSYGWYDGRILYNSGDSTGCAARGPSNNETNWQFNMNQTRDAEYLAAALGGTIYVMIKFTGVVKLSGLLLT